MGKIVELGFEPDKFKVGGLLFRTDLNQLFVNKGTFAAPDFIDIGEEAATQASSTPAGLVQMFAGLNAKIPSGWKRCDGAAISRTTFSDLFDTIGTTWGPGDGSTTFNLPNFETNNKFPRAANSDGEVANTGGSDTHNHTVVKEKVNWQMDSDTGFNINTASPGVMSKDGTQTGSVVGNGHGGVGGRFDTFYDSAPDGSQLDRITATLRTQGQTVNSVDHKPRFASIFYIIKT